MTARALVARTTLAMAPVIAGREDGAFDGLRFGLLADPVILDPGFGADAALQRS